MEFLGMTSLPIALSLLFLGLFIFAFNRKWGDIDAEWKLPPGSFGWPIIGETLEFVFGKPETFVLDRMKKYSPDIFKTKILGEKTVVICGADGNKFLFSKEGKYFTAFRPHSMQKIFQQSRRRDTAPECEAGVEAKTKFIMRAPGFLRPEALVHYLEKMDSITQHQLQAHWNCVGKEKREVKVFPFAKKLTLTLGCRFFLGIEEPERIAALVTNFDDITMGLHSIPFNFPGTVFYRANKAAAAIQKELLSIIYEKKAAISATGQPMRDILSHMIVSADPTGRFMPEAEIADKIMGLLTAGYSTVATAITFLIKYIGLRPDIDHKILAEQSEIAATKQPGDFLVWDDMQKMKYSWNTVYEVMRFVPPIQGTFRTVLEDFTYAGYDIPKGMKVYWTVSSTNKNPAYFPEPEKFDPTRYEEGMIRSVREAAPPFAFVPFGGGVRTCPGKEYARLVILTFLHNVVKRYKWEVLLPNEKIVGDMLPRPQKGLPVLLQPRYS